MAGIKLLNIKKIYNVEQNNITVLNAINLDINEKEITIILGRSGCGKTTLLRIVAGLEKQDFGELRQYDIKNKAYVFQEDRLMPWLNVRENVAFGLKNKKNIDNDKIDYIIELVGLKNFCEAYPNQLSGGMKQRVSIARAFAYDTDFIMMDEPFSALDYFTREQMQKELLKIYNKTECSILFVTHSIDEALILGNKIVVLEKGNVKSEYIIDESNENRDLLSTDFVNLKKKIIDDLKI